MTGKATGGKVASIAGRTLGSVTASTLQRSLAGSALAQSRTSKVSSKPMETKASAALKNPNSSTTTRKQAGSVTSQSRKTP
ncbi:hypothetical protein D3C87_900850 [compost metagenome]